MLHIRRYLKILGESRKIIDGYGSFPDVDDKGYRSALLIYETAFEQLAASGMPLSEERDVLRIDTDGDTFILRKKGPAGRYRKAERPLQENHALKEERIPQEEPPGKYIEETVGNEGKPTAEYAASDHQAVPERKRTIEESALHAAPDEEKKEAGMAGSGDGEELDDSLPDDYGIDVTVAKELRRPDEGTDRDKERDDEKSQNAEEPEGQRAETKSPATGSEEDPAGDGAAVREGSPAPAGFDPDVLEGVETEYEKKETVEMPDHLYKDDFTFSYSDIRITGANGKKAEAQVIIAPISISEEYPRIICCTIQGDKSETALSGDNRLKIRVGGFTVKVEGRMEDGKFKSSCVLPAHYLLEGTRIETKTRDFGTKGHILLEEKEENLQIHIIPATFKNNASGNAEYIYFISNNGEETAGDTSVVKTASFTFGGKEYEIRCRWNADGVLYSMAAEKGVEIGTVDDV